MIPALPPRSALLAPGLLDRQMLATVLALTDIGDMIPRQGAAVGTDRA